MSYKLFFISAVHIIIFCLAFYSKVCCSFFKIIFRCFEWFLRTNWRFFFIVDILKTFIWDKKIFLHSLLFIYYWVIKKFVYYGGTNLFTHGGIYLSANGAVSFLERIQRLFSAIFISFFNKLFFVYFFIIYAQFP